MAVIITNGTGIKLSDANAFWTVAAHNLSTMPNSTTHGVSLASYHTRLFTSSSTDKFKGVMLGFYATSATIDKNIDVYLQQTYNGATISIASPAVITVTGHDFVEGQRIQFNTTGVLPTGMNVNTHYFVRNPNILAGTFNISTTISGVLLNTSGTQSGTHSAFPVRAYKQLLYDEIIGFSGSTGFQKYFAGYLNFTGFDVEPNLTTTTNGWRICVGQSGGISAANWVITYGYDVATITYAVYTETNATFTDNDTPIFAHPTEIDTSCTFGGVLGVGDTIAATAGFICANMTDITPDNISFLTCLNPSTAYTLTLKGSLVMGTHSGLRIGTSGSTIPYNKQFSIKCDAPTVGTVRGRITGMGQSEGSTNSLVDYSCKSSVFLYGEYPTLMKTSLTGNEIIGKMSILTTDDMSTIWGVGDEIGIGKTNFIGNTTVSFFIRAFGVVDITPKMTAANVPAPYVVSASGTYSTYYPYEAFDYNFNGLNERWLVTSTTNSWLKIDMGSGTTLTEYMMWNGINATTKEYAPKDWTFEGSDDDTTWTVLDTQINITNWDNNNFYILSGGAATYRYYRINITSNNGGALYTNICEVKLFNVTGDNKNIQLTTPIPTYDRKINASVLNLTSRNFGINWYDNDAVTIMRVKSLSNLNIEGIYTKNILWSNSVLSTSFRNGDDPDSALIKSTFKNTMHVRTIVLSNTFLYYQRIPRHGLDAINNYGWRCTPTSAMVSVKTAGYKSGTFNLDTMYCLQHGGSLYVFQWFGKTICLAKNIYAENSAAYPQINFDCFKGSVLENIYAWGCAGSYGSYYGVLYFGAPCGGQLIKNIYVDKSHAALGVTTTGYLDGVIIDNFNCGTIEANPYDYIISPNCKVNCIIKNSTGFATMYNTNLTETVEGTQIRFVNHNDISHNDYVQATYGNFYRTGDGLSDTTVHTAGSGKYAMKMCPIDATNEHYWSFNIPTGDISGKTMSVAVWVKINNAAYYAGVHTNPTLQITYDEVTTITSVAANSTDWQLLTVSFTPATDYGQIEFKVYGSSDAATEAERCFYVDDISVFYPAGVSLNLGGMDLWADALPITPPISTSVNANDVWAVLPSTFTDGSIGAMVVKIDKTGSNNQGLILSK